MLRQNTPEFGDSGCAPELSSYLPVEEVLDAAHRLGCDSASNSGTDSAANDSTDRSADNRAYLRTGFPTAGRDHQTLTSRSRCGSRRPRTTASCCRRTAQTNVWTYLTGVYDASTHTSRLYVNGVLSAKSTNISTWYESTMTDTWVGRSDSTYWEGDLSGVHVYQSPLTQAQILADMNS
jgi:hypothetical protein